jgi:hypothetical protein
MPPRDNVPRREPMPPRPGASRPAPPREYTYPDPSGPGPGGGAGRHAPGRPPSGHGASGHAAPGYPPPGPGGAGHAPPGAGRPGPAGAAADQTSFDGGYAPVIRAEDLPTPTVGPARPAAAGRGTESRTRPPNSAEPAGESAPDVYVYREGEDPVTRSGEGNAAYWYDDLGNETTPAPDTGTRGPFEPLVSSSDPPGTVSSPAPAEPAGSDRPADSEPAPERKLEQIKDLYLTAQAIGEENVDKHFDHLLAQQRELIGEFFQQSGAPGRPAPSAGSAPPTPPEGAEVAAEPPAW